MARVPHISPHSNFVQDAKLTQRGKTEQASMERPEPVMSGPYIHLEEPAGPVPSPALPDRGVPATRDVVRV